MSARTFLFVSRLRFDPSTYLRNRRPDLLKAAFPKFQAALSLRGKLPSDRSMLPEAQNPRKPRDRLPAGSPIAEMVAQEQKTNSPNFSIITEELDACQLPLNVCL